MNHSLVQAHFHIHPEVQSSRAQSEAKYGFGPDSQMLLKEAGDVQQDSPYIENLPEYFFNIIGR